MWQAAIARLEALENDAGVEMVQPLDDDDASLDDDDQGIFYNLHTVFVGPFFAKLLWCYKFQCY